MSTQNRTETAPQAAAAAPSALQRWWHSRAGAEMLKELVIVVGLFLLYRLGRQLGKQHVDNAFENARQVIRFENRFGFGNEIGLQQQLLPHRWVIQGLNQYYARVHFPVSVGFIVFCYIRWPDTYKQVRKLFIIVTSTALVIHLAYPLAPPRMMPGFVDTIARYGPTIYGSKTVANQFAAMPSLHFGWAVLVAYGVWHATQGVWRFVAILHPFLTLSAIVVTANHYWLDPIVAGAIVALALLFEHWRTSPTNRTIDLRDSTMATLPSS